MAPEGEIPDAQRTETGMGEEGDFTAPLVFRAMGRRRFEQPLGEVGLVSMLTLIYFANGGYGQFRYSGGAVADGGATLLLLLLWTVALVRLYAVWRYVVRVDAQGITVFNGFFRRQVRWNEGFIAEWRPGALGHNWRKAAQAVETLEIRDAAGQVKMRLNGNLLRPHREALERCINGRFRTHMG